MLPAPPDVDPASVQVLPQDLAEEVECAKAAKAAGWLRLLSQEVETRRFQWAAMRVMGQAQWDIEDSEGVRRTYQKLIDNDADDLDANSALANLYERQYRREKRAELLVTGGPEGYYQSNGGSSTPCVIKTSRLRQSAQRREVTALLQICSNQAPGPKIGVHLTILSCTPFTPVH